MSIITQYAIRESERELLELRSHVQWAKRNPYQCNLTLWQERLRDAIVRYDDLLKQLSREEMI